MTAFQPTPDPQLVFGQGEKKLNNESSPLIHRPLPAPSAAVPPTPASNNGLRLKSYASNGVDFLPTTNLPVPDNNDRGQQTQSVDDLTPRLDSQQQYQQYQNQQQYQQQQQQQQHPASVQTTRNVERSLLPVTPPEVASIQNGNAATSFPPGTSQSARNGVPVPTGTVRSAVGSQNHQVVGRHVILYRAANFFVATVSRQGVAPPSLRRRSGQTTILPAFAPQQRQRVAASDTRMMPKVGPINPISARSIPLPNWIEAIVVIVGLIGASVAHAYNMFNYPQYGLDEGTYMSSAWAIVHGMLAPYPYGYGHPPFGWIQIAGWVQLTGGFFTFGDANNTGRVLMMFYAIGSTLLVYLIVRRLDGSRVAALLAMAIFSLSPLSIAFQRLVLLDNIATFWLLLSIYLIVVSNSRLLFIVFAAVAFGCSLLSKEVMLLFFPVMIYAVWLHTTKFQRKFALVAFVYCFVALGSTFILMAILRGELLPAGWLPWDTHPHLSLFTTYLQQVQRGQSGGNLSDSFSNWDKQDELFIIVAIATTIFNLIIGWWKRKSLLLALLALSFWVLFLRNGIVFPFYIIPLLPLSAFNAAVAVNTIMRWLTKLTRFDIARVILIFGIIGGIVVYDVQDAAPIFTQNLTFVQTNALTWVRNNVSHDAVVVINSYFYTDLHEAGGEGVGSGTTFEHADIYWNVAYDPELHDSLLGNNWDNIDYIITDAPMLNDIEHLGGDMNLIDEALQHSFLRADFRPTKYDRQDAIDIYQVIHKNTPAISSTSPTNITKPSVGADLSRPARIYRLVQPTEADKSALGAIMHIDELIRPVVNRLAHHCARALRAIITSLPVPRTGCPERVRAPTRCGAWATGAGLFR